MSEFYLEILPKSQRKLLDVFFASHKKLNKLGFYLAGGTALALQMGHRQSVDFDFFSRKAELSSEVCDWLETFPDFMIRDRDSDTVHAELAKIKVSFISSYRYPLVQPPVQMNGLHLAHITEIGTMKLLAITHRATLRDYIDLAAILDSGVDLEKLLKLCQKKYSRKFNPLLSLKALVSFDDLDRETPRILHVKLLKNWQEILKSAVKKVV